jgi:radical SAM protein with 4Fe4S-binding SPASM domain
VDSVNWDDLEDIQWITVNVTDISIDELSRRMKIIDKRSNAINQTIAATLDDYNLERIIDVSRFGLENGYRLRYSRDLYRGIDAEYKRRLLKKYHELCDLFESLKQKGYKVHTTFLFDTLIPSWDLDISPFNCGKRVAAVFPDGSIGPCLRDHSFKTGTIFDPDPMKIITCEKFHYELTRPGTPDECKSCESGAVCQGGCPHDKLLLTGTAVGKSLVCDIHREIIPRLKHIDAMSNE